MFEERRNKPFYKISSRPFLIAVILHLFIIIAPIAVARPESNGEDEIRSRATNYTNASTSNISAVYLPEDKLVHTNDHQAGTTKNAEVEQHEGKINVTSYFTNNLCPGRILYRRIHIKKNNSTVPQQATIVKQVGQIAQAVTSSIPNYITTSSVIPTYHEDINGSDSSEEDKRQIPKGCNFLPDTLNMVCLGSSLTTIPDLTHLVVYSLAFISTDILTLDRNSVRYLPRTHKLAFYDGTLFTVDFSELIYELSSLTELIIVKNGLSSFSFSEFSFAFATNNHPLKVLNLQENSIGVLPAPILNHIPVLSSLEEIYLSHNPLGVLPGDFFQPLRSSMVRILHLRDCQLRSIGKQSLNDDELISPFIYLPGLKEVDLTNNPILRTNLLSLILSPLRQGALERLYLNMNNYDRVPKMAIFHVSHSLEELQLDGSAFSCLDRLSFPKMSSLKYLSLRSSRISQILDGAFDNLPQLQTLYLDNNFLTFIPDALKLSSLVVLSLTNNPNSLMTDEYNFQLRSFTFVKMQSLQYLYLTQNPLVSISRHDFSGLDKLINLDLSECSIEEIEEYSFFDLHKLQCLYLGRNSLTKLDDHTFGGLENLSFLDLSKNQLGAQFMPIGEDVKYYPSDSDDKYVNSPEYNNTEEIRANVTVFNSLHNLQYLHLNHNHIDLAPQLFDGLFNLRKLFMDGNVVSSWKFPALTQNTRLEFIGLHDNVITIFTDAMAKDMQKEGLVVDLTLNTFVCSCDFYDYKYILNETFFFKNFTYMCSDENRTWFLWIYLQVYNESTCSKSAQVTRMPEDEATAFNPPAVVKALAIFLGTFLIVMTLGVATYRNRWYGKYLAYKVRSKMKTLSPDKNAEHDYDTFICYSHTDRQWVFETLVNKLESSKRGFCVCVHERDFLAGEAVTHNIVYSIERSRKVLVVLSQSFVHSSWCMFELEMATSKILSERKKNKLIIIILEDINIKEQPKSLRAVLKRRTYIQWNSDIEGQRLFFARLFRAIAKPNASEEFSQSESEISLRVSTSSSKETFDNAQIGSVDFGNAPVSVHNRSSMANSASNARQTFDDEPVQSGLLINDQGVSEDIAETSNMDTFGAYDNRVAIIQMNVDEPNSEVNI